MAKIYVQPLRRGWKETDVNGNVIRDDWVEYESMPDHWKPLEGELVLEYDNGLPRLKIGDGIHEFSELPYMSIDSFILPKQAFVELSTNWIEANKNGKIRYYQEVTVSNATITLNSKVDLQPTAEQLYTFHQKDLAFVAENEGGVIRVYCVGLVPQNGYTIPATVTEVVAEDESTIIGNTTATPNPQPDWAQTDETKADYIKNKPDVLTKADNVLPDYWEAHLADKIGAVKALQDKGGKDCFSFVVMTDMHYPSNLGKCSPALAKEVLDKCDIRYALCLGDVQTRGCHNTKALLLAENEQIEEMLSPIRDRLLQTEGNHDGSYGWLDRDGNGISNEGKEPAERESYVNNLTPAELHSAIYRKVGLVGDAHFDESGSGYYIDDTANKVRYIVLNTHCNDYELQEDGTSKYPKMWVFRFTQSQFDLVIEALNNIPSASWGVVVAGHCPLFQEIGDREIMQGVLNAYKNKTTYTGEYAGTASGGMVGGYTNLADPTSADWKDGYRIGSTGLTANTGLTVSNLIEWDVGDVIRVTGISGFKEGETRVCDTTSNTTSGNYAYVNSLPNDYFGYDVVDGVHTFTLLQRTNSANKYFRVCFITPTDPSTVIVTKNEEIIEGTVSEKGYDYVSVDCDFSQAKGELVGYFNGHIHYDHVHTGYGFNIISTRCDAKEENDEALNNERVAGTITEQSFDVFTVNKSTRTIYATKIGAGTDRQIGY